MINAEMGLTWIVTERQRVERGGAESLVQRREGGVNSTHRILLEKRSMEHQ